MLVKIYYQLTLRQCSKLNMKPLFPTDTQAKTNIQTSLPSVALPSSLETGALQAVAPKVVLVAFDEAELDKKDLDAQSCISSVSTELASLVRAADAGSFGQSLNQLVLTAKKVELPSHKKGSFVSRIRDRFTDVKERVMASYVSVETQINSIVAVMEKNALLYQKRIEDLEQMYVKNFEAHQTLARTLDELKALESNLAAYIEQEKDTLSQDPFAAQSLAELQRKLMRIQIRISNRERALLLAKTTAVEIKLSQDGAHALVQKFGEIKLVSLPAWRNEFSIFIVQQELLAGAELADTVDDFTNNALRRGAALLRQNSVQIAEARQRPVVTIETLEEVSKNLIGSIEDVARIEKEGTARRVAESNRIEALTVELTKAVVGQK